MFQSHSTTTTTTFFYWPLHLTEIKLTSLPEKMLLLLQLLLLLLLDYLKKILYFQIHTKLFLHITKCPHSKFFSLFPIVTLCFLLWLGVGAWYCITVFELLLRWHIERVINENNWTLIVRIASVFSFSGTEIKCLDVSLHGIKAHWK